MHDLKNGRIALAFILARSNSSAMTIQLKASVMPDSRNVPGGVDTCPCHSGTPFAECCQPYILGAAQAPTALALMRSRYAAFCTEEIGYLYLTRHSAARDPDERRALARSVADIRWQNLLIVETSRGGTDDSTGVVQFVAAFRKAPRPVLMAASGDDAGVQQLHERSRFERENGHWRYVDGDAMPPIQQKRNAACWCGSGRKFKDCHR